MPRLVAISVTMKGREGEDKGEKTDGSKVGRRMKQRESRQRVGGNNESGGGSRLSARALSISSALHAGLVITRRSPKRETL